MNKREIAFLASRLMALWAWLQALLFVGALFVNFDSPNRQYIFLLLGSVFLLSAAGCGLFFGADQLSRRLLPPEEPGALPLEVGELPKVAVSIVGLLTIVSALPDVARRLTEIFSYSPFNPHAAPLGQHLTEQLPMLVSLAMKLVVGIGLFLRPEPLLRWQARRQYSAPAQTNL